MAKMELFGGRQQVPADAGLLVGCNEQTGDTEIYITMSTGGPPFGTIPSIRPFMMEDGDLYGAVLRDILQHQVDHGGENCLNTNESLDNRSQKAKFLAHFFEEFAAKFHQKAISLRNRMVSEDE